MSLNLLRPMIYRWWVERKKTGTPTEREEDGRRRKKGIDIQSGGRKRNGISLLFLQAPLMEFQDVADTKPCARYRRTRMVNTAEYQANAFLAKALKKVRKDVFEKMIVLN